MRSSSTSGSRHPSRIDSTTLLTRRAFVTGLAASAVGLALGGLVVRDTAAAPLADDVLNPAARAPGQLSPLITPNAAFYVVTKNAGGDPVIDAASWRMVIDGQVNSPVQLDYATLQQLPQVQVVKTLECISNLTAQCEQASFGCGLISNAAWIGARLSDVFDLAGGLKPDVVTVAAIAADEFTSAIPLDAALDPETLIVYQMNGAPLPAAHGFPARVLVPGRYGMKNPKWVVQLRPMNRQFVDWYGQRNWSLQAIVNTMSRIDVPAPGAELPAGPQTIAGIAYAGDRGISAVEYSADGGATWQPAGPIEPQPGRDTWVRWQGTFTLAAGQVAQLVVRATDGTGALQTDQFSLAQPNGATGWNSVTVKGV
jgi:DMSO/TMAO reductase YedYZ molybdopterin-dependent catalytic subunit